MSFYSVAGSIVTVVSFVAFIAIVAWAWSAKRRKAFDEAANAPFALPDDSVPSAVASEQKRAERRS
jgi:cytochrome c oxidase cbb3-type subunit IV